MHRRELDPSGDPVDVAVRLWHLSAMATSTVRRTALATVVLPALAVFLAGTHCSSTNTVESEPDSCSVASNELGYSKTVRVGDIEVRREVSTSRSVIHERLVATHGSVLLLMTESYATVAAEPKLVLDVRYGAEFTGPKHFVFENQPATKALSVYVDGRRAKDINAGNTALVDAETGSVMPSPLVAEPIKSALDAAIAKASAGGASCTASGLASSSQAIKDPVHEVEGSVLCAACFAGCVASAGFIATAGTYGCLALSWCPPCAAVCWAALVTATAYTLWACSESCDAQEFCKFQGPRCDSRPEASPYRCRYGQSCLDAKKQLCCEKDTTACNGQCCESSKGETCTAGGCCTPPSKAIDGTCCPVGSQRVTSAGKEVCCDSKIPVCDDGSCCSLGSCAGGKCCTNSCGSACCSAGEECSAGKCCPVERACGIQCCLAGEVCLDKTTGLCGKPGSVTCPPGQLPKLDPIVPGTYVCCAAEQGACNGSCCGLGTMCCNRGGGYQCRTDCIR